MIDINAFNSSSGVGIASVSWTHHVSAGAAATAYASAAHAAAAPAIMPRKRRTTAATLASVHRGTM